MEPYSNDYSEDNYEYGENYTQHREYQLESEKQNNLFCDPCERGFATAAELNEHLQNHRVCGIDGCKFVAHTKIVEKHITMQHESGLYYRITQSDSPEDIAKWIAARKKRYPTKENIEKRQKEQQEKINRGERIFEPKDRFGRKTKNDSTNKKGQHNKKNRRNKKNKLLSLRKIPPKLKKLTHKDLPSVSLLNDKSSWNGKLPPFQGTSELYESENEVAKEDIFDDNEWLIEEQNVPKIELNNALGALIGAYRSSDESDNEINVPETKIVPPEVPTPQIIEVIKNEEKIDDGEAPEEVKIIKEDQYLDNKKENVNVDNQNPESNRKRKRKRSRTENTSNKKLPGNNLRNQQTFPRQITLLERLLGPEIRHERNLILQCVRYVVKNNFFQNIDENNVSKTENIDNIPTRVYENNIEMKESHDTKKDISVDESKISQNICENSNNPENKEISNSENIIEDKMSEVITDSVEQPENVEMCESVKSEDNFQNNEVSDDNGKDNSAKEIKISQNICENTNNSKSIVEDKMTKVITDSIEQPENVEMSESVKSEDNFQNNKVSDDNRKDISAKETKILQNVCENSNNSDNIVEDKMSEVITDSVEQAENVEICESVKSEDNFQNNEVSDDNRKDISAKETKISQHICENSNNSENIVEDKITEVITDSVEQPENVEMYESVKSEVNFPNKENSDNNKDISAESNKISQNISENSNNSESKEINNSENTVLEGKMPEVVIDSVKQSENVKMCESVKSEDNFQNTENVSCDKAI